MEKESKAVLPLKVSNADGSVTVKLKNPLKYGEEQIEELKIKRPKAKHLKGIDLAKMTSDGMLLILAGVTGEFPQALDELDLEDYFCCIEVINDFLPATAKVGKTA